MLFTLKLPITKYKSKGLAQIAHNVDVVGSQLSDCCIEGSHPESVLLSNRHRLGTEGFSQLGSHVLIILFSSLTEHQHLLQQALQLKHAITQSSLRPL